MELLLRIDVNIIATILLTIVYLIARKELDKKARLNRAFIFTSLVIITETVLETLTVILESRGGSCTRFFLYIFTLFSFMSGPLITYSWYSFIRTWVVPNNKKFYRDVFLLTPILINFFLSVASVYSGIYFYIDHNNQYFRGDFYALSAGFAYFYFVLSTIMVLVYKKHIPKHDFIPILFVGVIPTLGGIIQVLLYGTLYIWSSCAFTLVLIFTYVQKRMIHLDYLTEVWSRESFFLYFYQRFERERKEVPVIFIDMDNLHIINDKFGHVEGDIAIRNTADIIKTSLKRRDIIARYGGDEFIVALHNENIDEIGKVIELIEKNFSKYNRFSKKAYKLSVTYGFDVYGQNYESLEDFLKKIDEKMYENKKTKKESMEDFV